MRKVTVPAQICQGVFASPRDGVLMWVLVALGDGPGCGRRVHAGEGHGVSHPAGVRPAPGASCSPTVPGWTPAGSAASPAERLV